MGIRDMIREAFEWCANEVQKTTGESERRENISRLKELVKEFQTKVTATILSLNEAVAKFNEYIQALNAIRNSQVKANIDVLSVFLRKFGSCKSAGEYAHEQEKIPAEFPSHELYKIEDYIGEVDWSNNEVFLNTFLMSPVFMRMKTRKQNLSLQEHINEFILQTDATVRELQTKQFCTELEAEVCKRYISNIQVVSGVISEKILPELELVEAFFQAEKIKNEVICGHELRELSFTYNLNAIVNTTYHKHYQFVKNAFAFYVLSCRIYNTPVLTNLLHSKTTENDVEQLKNERKLLDAQTDSLCKTMAVERKGEQR